MTATTRDAYVPAAINARLHEYDNELAAIRDLRATTRTDPTVIRDLWWFATDNAAAELTRLEAFLDGDTNEGGDRRER